MSVTVHKNTFFIIVILIAGVLLLARCMQNESKEEQGFVAAGYDQYAGSEACQKCHQHIYDSFLLTNHHLTSATASAKSILGSFNADSNRFYFNPQLYIAAEQRKDSFYQTAYKGDSMKVSRPFDFVVGSGKRGQTFLYWHNNSNIFQLPLTWFTATGEWTNSPGYSNKVQFNRPVTARCLECHSTYLTETTPANAKADEFSKTKMILGVECEKCHGPAAAHVAFQLKNPELKTAQYVVNPAKLTRVQQLDMCRLCHGGRLSKTQPSFSFTAGNKLSEFFKLDTTATNIEEMDVHGNQYGMLSASKCFKMSSITCNTCHNAHQTELASSALFVQKCMACHGEAKKQTCKLSGKVSEAVLKSNCIGCHMPEQPSKTIMVLRQGESVPTSAYMRSHYITVYPDESKKILGQGAGK